MAYIPTLKVHHYGGRTLLEVIDTIQVLRKAHPGKKIEIRMFAPKLLVKIDGRDHTFVESTPFIATTLPGFLDQLDEIRETGTDIDLVFVPSLQSKKEEITILKGMYYPYIDEIKKVGGSITSERNMDTIYLLVSTSLKISYDAVDRATSLTPYDHRYAHVVLHKEELVEEARQDLEEINESNPRDGIIREESMSPRLKDILSGESDSPDQSSSIKQPSNMRRTATTSTPSASAASRRAADSDSDFEDGEITPRRAAPSSGVASQRPPEPDEEYYSGGEDDTTFFYKSTFTEAIKLALARRVSDIYLDIGYTPTEGLVDEIRTVLNEKVYPVGVKFHLLHYPGDVRAEDKYSNFMRDVNVITDLVSSQTWKPQKGGKGVFLTDRLTRGVDLEMDVIKFGTQTETNRAVLEGMYEFMSQELKNFIDLAPHTGKAPAPAAAGPASTGPASTDRSSKKHFYYEPTLVGSYPRIVDFFSEAKLMGKSFFLWLDIDGTIFVPNTQETISPVSEVRAFAEKLWRGKVPYGFLTGRLPSQKAETVAVLRQLGFDTSIYRDNMDKVGKGTATSPDKYEVLVDDHLVGNLITFTKDADMVYRENHFGIKVGTEIEVFDPVELGDVQLEELDTYLYPFLSSEVGKYPTPAVQTLPPPGVINPASAASECHTCADLELRLAQLSERLQLSEAYEKAQAEFIYWQFVEKKTPITDDKGKKHTIRSLMDLVQTPNMNPLKEDKGRAGLGIWIREDTIRILEAEGSFPRQV